MELLVWVKGPEWSEVGRSNVLKMNFSVGVSMYNEKVT
jgi:hypothetical protein